MGAYSGSEISNEGLVFHFDMDNTDKSWRGAPTTNLSVVGGKYFDGNGNFTIDETIQDVLPDGTIGDVRYLKAEYVYDPNRTVSIGNYNLTAGSTYTLSFYVKNINCTGFNGNLYSPGLGRVIGGISYPTIYTDRWARVVKTFTIPDEGIDPVIVSPQAFRDGGYGVFKMCWLQLEQGSTVTAYAEGTRSNTQAIVDMTGQNTITATNGLITYNSDGTFEFDGANDYLDLGYRPDLLTDSKTNEAWVNASSFTNWHGIISNMNSWGTGFSLQIGSVQNIAAMIEGIYLKTSWTPSTNTWYHIVATRDGNTNQNILYVNGVREASLTRSVTYASNAVTRIGCFYTSPSLYFPGEISQVKVYNRALTAKEVKNNYLATKSRYGL